MRVRYKTTFAGPDGSGQAGDVAEVEDKRATQLINDDLAEEMREVPGEYTTAFHGGLTAVVPHKVEHASIPPNPDMSTTRERAEVALDEPLDRRTADELAADARREAVGPVSATGPPEHLSSEERVAREIETKVSLARAAAVDDKGSAHEKLVKDRGKEAKHPTAKHAKEEKP